MEDRLQKFAKLIDAGSFTRGAAQLHMSQPALTTAVKKLERELHAELVKRGARHLQLTAAGELAYTAGKNLTAHSDNLRQALAALSTQRTPFALGTIDSVADMLFVRGSELDALEQWAEVALSINNSSVLIGNVLKHELDAAIVADYTGTSKLLVATSLGTEPLVVVTHPDNAAAASQAVQNGSVPNFLSYNQGSNTQRLVQAAAKSAGITLKPSFYSTGPEIMLRLVLAGRGVTALPYLNVAAALAAGTLVPVYFGKSPIVARPIASVQLAARDLPKPFADSQRRIASQLATLNDQALRLK